MRIRFKLNMKPAAKAIKSQREVYAAIFFSSSGIHGAIYSKDLPPPYNTILLIVFVAAAIWGVIWGGYRLAVPRTKAKK